MSTNQFRPPVTPEDHDPTAPKKVALTTGRPRITAEQFTQARHELLELVVELRSALAEHPLAEHLGEPPTLTLTDADVDLRGLVQYVRQLVAATRTELAHLHDVDDRHRDLLRDVAGMRRLLQTPSVAEVMSDRGWYEAAEVDLRASGQAADVMEPDYRPSPTADAPQRHVHQFQRQTLIHSHPHTGPHGYYGHDEDPR